MTLVPTLRNIVEHQMGYVTDSEVEILARADRLRSILVRCGGCRFTCAAQDVAHLIAILEREGSDYVRDVSLPSSDDAFRGVWRKHTQDPPEVKRPATKTSPAVASHSRNRGDPAEYGGAFDGVNVISDADPGL